MPAINNQNQNKRFFRLKTGKDGAKPYFTENIKSGSSYMETGEFNELSGILTDMSVKHWTHDNKPYVSFVLTIQDSVDTFLVEMPSTYLAKGIINSLLSCTPAGNVRISVYLNKKGYPSASIESNGNRAEWFLSLDEQKELVDYIEFKGKKMSDDTRLLEKLEDLINERKGLIISAAPQPQQEVNTDEWGTMMGEQSGFSQPKDSLDEQPFDDLPF